MLSQSEEDRMYEEAGKYVSQKWVLTTIVSLLIIILSGIGAFYHNMIMSNDREIVILMNKVANLDYIIKDSESRHKGLHQEQLLEIRANRENLLKQIEFLNTKQTQIEWQVNRIKNIDCHGGAP